MCKSCVSENAAVDVRHVAGQERRRAHLHFVQRIKRHPLSHVSAEVWRENAPEHRRLPLFSFKSKKNAPKVSVHTNTFTITAEKLLELGALPNAP